MKLPKRLLLLLRIVFALPKASSTGLACSMYSSTWLTLSCDGDDGSPSPRAGDGDEGDIGESAPPPLIFLRRRRFRPSGPMVHRSWPELRVRRVSEEAHAM